jgi:hypothetical protein
MGRPAIDTPKGRARAITAEMAARLLMISPGRFEELVAAGWIPKPTRRQFDYVEVVQGYLHQLHEPDSAPPWAKRNALVDEDEDHD